jgi:hypothetical protein
MDSARVAQAYKATLFAEAEAVFPGARTDKVCDRFRSDLQALSSAVARMGGAGGSLSSFRGLLLAILGTRSVATRSDEDMRGPTWTFLVEDLDAFDMRYGYRPRPGSVTSSNALARMKSGDCVRHAMSCAINDHRSLRATALDLRPGLAIAHLFAPPGDLDIDFREPVRFVA